MSWELRYRDQVDRVRAQVRATVPEGSRILVVSRGDEALLRLGRRRGEHFPQSSTGLYAGHYPSDGEEAVAHLRELRAAGAEFLVFPAEASWWLEHYPGLRQVLESEGELVSSDPEAAQIYALKRGGSNLEPPSPALEAARVGQPVSSLLRALLPHRAGVVLIGLAAEAIEMDDRPCWRLPPDPVESVIKQAHAACAAGARFVVLLHPDQLTEALDGRYRPTFAKTMKLVCRQRLAEVFEVGHG
jgi:hypothetical protein